MCSYNLEVKCNDLLLSNQDYGVAFSLRAQVVWYFAYLIEFNKADYTKVFL